MSLVAGTRLGPYEIQSAIGAGGMGEVYKARDTRLDRDVAIKVLPTEFAADAERSGRFEREARMVAALSHPNVLSIFEFGCEAGVAFAVTELLVGHSLRERLEAGPLPIQKVLDYGCQVAKGLAAAHKRGIVHRDLKPENVFVTNDGVVKVLDFGLARHQEVVASSGVYTSFRSQPGVVLGTAGYMSPEQVRGEPADTKSDIFSLGAVLYELLTGRPAFKRETTAETMSAVLREEPAETRAGGGSVASATLERLVRRCLEKRPEDRFQSAGDLAFYLESVLHGSLADATPPAGVGDTPRGNRVIKVLSVALLVLAAVAVYVSRGTIASLWGASAAVRNIAVVNDPQPGTPANVDQISRQLVETLTDRLSQLPGLGVIPQMELRRLGSQALDMARLRKELGVEAVVTVAVEQTSGDYAVRVRLVDMRTSPPKQVWGEVYIGRASTEADVVDGISTKVTDQLQLRLNAAEKSRMEAYGLYLKGRYYWRKRNEEALRKAVEYFHQVIRIDQSNAPAYAGLANAQSLLSYYAGVSPSDSFPKARDWAQKALALDESLPEAHAALGLVLRDYDHAWVAAEAELKRAIELNGNYATAHQWYAEYLAALGRNDEAIREIQQAEDTAPLEPIIASVHGWIYYVARRPEEAIAQLRKTIEREPTFTPAHWFLALAYAQKGRLGDAIASCETAVKLGRGSAQMTAYLAAINARSGKRDVAVGLLRRLDEVRKSGGYVSPYDMALVHVALGDRDRAFALLDQAITDRRWELVNVKVDWMLDPIRDDPRFSKLVRRMGLPD